MLNSTDCSASSARANAQRNQIPLTNCRSHLVRLLDDCMLLTQTRRCALPCAAKTRSALASSMGSLLGVTKPLRKIHMLFAVG
jgi:hypothetical protein